MKMVVVMTRKEFETAILAALNVYQKAEIDGIYLRLDGGIECTVRTVEEKPVHLSHSASGSTNPQLWTPDPPPFIHSVEPTAEQAEEQAPRPLQGWWPPLADGEHIGDSKLCACGSRFYVTEKHGWVYDGALHTLRECEEAQVEERPWKEIEADWWPALPQLGKGTENLVAIECACGKYGVYAEHGWVANGNLHRSKRCEGEQAKVEAAPPAISDAAALSASSTGEHGTAESSDEDRIPL